MGAVRLLSSLAFAFLVSRASGQLTGGGAHPSSTTAGTAPIQNIMRLAIRTPP